MKQQPTALETVRPANRQDIPFLAQMDLEAARSPLGRSFWEELLDEMNTPPLPFLEAMFEHDASLWGQIEDFLIIERNGQSVATCAVFRPSDTPGLEGPLNLGKLPQIAKTLGWDMAKTTSFEQAYTKAWGSDTSYLKPQAEMIVETVAVVPEHRGSGLGHSLMNAAFQRAREAGATSLGIMVIHGNEPAQALYEKYFERFTSFYPAFFNHLFPGLTKYRANLNSL